MAKKTRILFALLLVLVMVFTAACSDKDEPKSDKDNSSLMDMFGKEDSGDEPQPTEPSMEMNIVTEPTEIEEIVTEPTEIDETVTEPTEVPDYVPIQPVLDIAGTVLYDQDGIKITVTGFDSIPGFGPMIPVVISNSTDRDMIVQSDLMSVNGCMLGYGGFDSIVPAGTEVEDRFAFSMSLMAQLGITEVSKVEFRVDLLEVETTNRISVSDMITLNVTAECNQTFDYSGIEVYNNCGIRLICKGFGFEETGEDVVYFLAENTSGHNMVISGWDVCINDEDTTESIYIFLSDGKVGQDYIPLVDLSDYNLESIDQIETISMRIRVQYVDGQGDIDSTGRITINMKQ